MPVYSSDLYHSFSCFFPHLVLWIELVFFILEKHRLHHLYISKKSCHSEHDSHANWHMSGFVFEKQKLLAFFCHLAACLLWQKQFAVYTLPICSPSLTVSTKFSVCSLSLKANKQKSSGVFRGFCFFLITIYNKMYLFFVCFGWHFKCPTAVRKM